MTRDERPASVAPGAGLGQVQAAAPQAQRAFAVSDLVVRIEQEIERVATLFEKSRNAPLSKAEWRELSRLRLRYDGLGDRPTSEWPNGLLQQESPGCRLVVSPNLPPALMERAADARSKLLSLPLDEAIVHSTLKLPGQRGYESRVESRVMPGTALGARFAEGYPPNGVGQRIPLQYAHALGLAATTLVNADGRLLYAGLRNCPFLLEQPHSYLKHRLSAEERCETVYALFHEGGASWWDLPPFERLEHLTLETPELAMQYADRANSAARRSAERELPAAALVMDPEKLTRALDGETVDLHLAMIRTGQTPKHPWILKLLAPTRSEAARKAADESLPGLHRRNGAPVAIRLTDHDGNERRVSARVWIRDYFVDSRKGKVRGTTTAPAGADESSSASGSALSLPAVGASRSPSLERLVGATSSSDAECDVKSAVQDMTCQARSLRRLSDTLRQGFRAVGADGAYSVSNTQVLRTERQVGRLRDQAEALEMKARTLLAAAAQLKQLLGSWRWSSYSVSVPVEDQVSARLALICHLMGETPVICRADRSLAQQLDSEVKFLAAAAGSCDGRLPPLDGDANTWGRAREEFRASLAGQDSGYFDAGSWQREAP